MRIRSLVVIALLSFPAGLTAQARPLPRGGRVPTAQAPASLPPAAEPVARALAYQRSKWSTEGYSLISFLQAPAAAGGVTRYTTFGAGTRADFRYAEHFTVTADVTASYDGGPTMIETAELGTRFKPTGLDAGIRPFVDVRAGFTHMYDTFLMSYGSAAPAGQNQLLNEYGRYSVGFGGIAGTGLEISLTNSFALTTEVLALRNRMTVYHLTGPTNIPQGSGYWMTSFRYTLGLRYNAARVLHLAQNPMK